MISNRGGKIPKSRKNPLAESMLITVVHAAIDNTVPMYILFFLSGEKSDFASDPFNR
jgi:hypothetical protein